MAKFFFAALFAFIGVSEFLPEKNASLYSQLNYLNDSLEVVLPKISKVPGKKLEFYETKNTITYTADIDKGFIGTSTLQPYDNPYDNVFHLEIPSLPSGNYSAFLTYELLGVDDNAGITRSLNYSRTVGGYFVSLSDKWSFQKEAVPFQSLREGDNVIRFGLTPEASYHFQVKSVSIVFERCIHAKEEIIVDNSSDNYCNNQAYIKGLLQFPRESTTQNSEAKLYCNEKLIPLFNNEFEIVASKEEIGGNALPITLKAILPNGKIVKKTINLKTKGQPDYVFTQAARGVKREGLFIPEQGLSLSPDDTMNAGIAIPVKAMLTNQSVSIEGLSEIDLPIINPELINVTRGVKGFRILPQRISFLNKIKVQIPFDSFLIPEGYSIADIRTYCFDDVKREWVALTLDTIQQNERLVISSPPHFGDMINAIIKVPESPQTQGYTPTTIKDIKAANPSVGISLITPPTANNIGNAALGLAFKLPKGRQGLQPDIGIQYNNEGGNSWTGLGWNVTTPSISLDTRWGVPRYDPALETETYNMGGEQLAPLAHKGSLINRQVAKQFYPRTEGSFSRIIRHGNSPKNYWWEVTNKNGTSSFYGGTPRIGMVNNAVLKDDNGNIGHWGIVETRDINNNFIHYVYETINDLGISAGVVLGQQLYVSRITYTGYNNTDGSYSVDFITDRKLGEPKRKDIEISGRLGFKMVTADLLRKVVIRYNTAEIRTYELKYAEGAFYKTLLKSVTELDDTGAVFYTHEFNYFDDVQANSGYIPLGSTENWSPANDNIRGEITNPIPGFTGEASTLTSTKSTNSNFGLAVTLGIWDGSMSKSNTIGGSFGSGKGSTEGLITLVDINGDGLPDKIFKKNGQLFYRANLGAGSRQFGNVRQIIGVSNFNRGNSRSVSRGLEVNLLSAFWGRESSNTTNKTTDYFSDFNGDGLIDIAIAGQVYFNHLDSNGDPIFSLGSTLTPSPIILGSNINPLFLAPDTALQSRQEKDYPLQDIIRMWKAPYTGRVRITAPVQLQNTGTPGITNAKLDGIRTSIQLSGNVLWDTIIPAGDFAVRNPTGISDIVVQKGQKIYFRLQSIYNGDEDVVKWDPLIEYTTSTYPKSDATGRYTNEYRASSDFVLSNEQPFPLNKSGQIQIDGNFSKDATSDTVTLQIIKKSNGVSSIIQQIVYPANSIVNQAITVNSHSVNQGDSISCILKADSYIDRVKLQWRPHFKYTFFNDGTPIVNINGRPTIEGFLVPNNSNFNEWVVKTPLLISNLQDTIDVRPLVNGTPQASGVITFTVKSKDSIYGKRNVQIQNGQILSRIDSINIKRKPQDTLYCEFHIRDRKFAQMLQNTKFVTRKDTIVFDIINNRFVPSIAWDTIQAGVYTNPDSNYLGTYFRGWGHFSFKGDPSNGSLDETKLNANGLSNYSFDTGTFIDTTSFSQIADASLTEFVPLYPNSGADSWVGFDTSVYITGDKMSSARLWLHDVTVDSIMLGASLIAAEKITETNSTSYSLGLAVGISANSTSSSTTTVNKLDMMDMNGDRYPDVLHMNDIQFSLPNGGLESLARVHNLGSANFDGNSTGYTLGGSFPESAAKNTPSSLAQNTSSNAGSTVGISGSGSLTTNDDQILSNWLDINGDGLPDKMYANGNVALNLGYKFSAAEPWGFADIEKNNTKQNGAGISFGFNTAFGSFQGGFNLLSGDDKCSTSLEDINGDGLPDKLLFTSGRFQVRLNTGNGFGPLLNWLGPNLRKNSSTGESVNGAFTAAIPIPLIIIILKLCINPSFSYGNGVSKETDQISDIDGDGYPDFLHSQNDGNLTVERSTIGRTNMLRSVKRPLGSSFAIEYERLGNTYEMPQSKWVLRRVEVFDGVKSDGIDTMRSSFMYYDGNYNRDEREFYGFRKVTSSELDSTGNIYRTTVQQFLNTTYYTKGLVSEERLEDALGNKFRQTNNQYTLQTIQDSVQFPALTQTEELFFERNSLLGLSTKTQLAYDTIGNIIQINESGDGSIQDMVKATVTYHNNNILYLKNIPQSIEVTTVDGLRRKRSTTLDAHGNIIQIQQYLADGSAAIHDIEYDIYGNVSKIIRPVNHKGQRMWFKYSFDNSVNTYITKIEDAFGYTNANTYDYRFGELLETISENDEPMRYELDNKGRTIKIIGPYEITAGKPYTIAFEYHPDSIVPFAVTHHYDPEFNSDINTVTFIDGLERTLQIKKQVSLFRGKNIADEVKMVVSGRIIYDSYGRPIQNHYPITEAIGSLNNQLNANFGSFLSKSTFDILDRTLASRLADGATTENIYTIRNGFFSTRTKDPLQNVRETLSDVRGRNRITNLEGGPNGTITTKFLYNALSELERVIDAGGNSITTAYDNLGRKISTNHPDAGLVEMQYDLAGNLIKKITAQIRKEIPNGGGINYQYDFERLTDIDYPRQFQNKVKYTYGKAGTGSKAGRLILQEDASGGQEIFYGKLGEIIKTIRTIAISNAFYTTYVSEQEYDTWNRIKKMIYPDGEVVRYHYNKGGSLNSIDGYKIGHNYAYVNQLGYDEYEQRVYLQYGNGSENKYTYDPQRRRLSELQSLTTSGRLFLNNTYQFDAVSNIKSIANNVQAIAGKLGGFAKQNYQYDNLYRLTNANGIYKGAADSSDYALEMDYDDLYNIKRKKIDRGRPIGITDEVYEYGGIAPHQVTKTGNTKYTYDLNGNQLSKDARQYYWDEENRLMAVLDAGTISKYTYDASGERAIKSSSGLQGIWVNGAPAGFINHDTNYVSYVSPYLVCTRTGFTKHIYIEDQRISTKIGNGNFANISFSMPAITAGGIDYLKRLANIQKARFDYYAGLGISPGPPIDKYFYAHPYNSSIASPVITDTTASSIPPGWPGNTTPPINGPPIFVNPIPSNDSVKAGYGFKSPGHFAELNQYFYHPDHLGSTSYVTNILGEVSQHQEYSAFGETFFEEHNSSYESPYLFNSKEIDKETGLYYYGARYYDPKTSVWISVDPMRDKYPELSPYNYCLNNPLVLIDPDGRAAMDWVHGTLDVAGLVPGVGEIADGANSLIYLAEGNKTDAAISAAAMIPIAGWGATGAKAAKKLDKVLDVTKTLEKNKIIGKEGEKIVTEGLSKEFGEGKAVLNQVSGKFEDGSKTVFDNVVVDKKTGKAILTNETKTGKGSLTKQQGRYQRGESVTLTGKNAGSLKGQKINTSNTRMRNSRVENATRKVTVDEK